jgi:hypothetical protein
LAEDGLLWKDLPKPVNADRINKSNYRATILKLNAGIEQLLNKVLAEKNSAQSFVWKLLEFIHHHAFVLLAGGDGIANLGG